MKKSILFGAGADSVYGIGVGQSFVKPLLIDGYRDERRQMLDEGYNFSLIHKNSRKIYLQTIISNEPEARRVLGDDLVNRCIRKYNGEANIEGIPFEEWYSLLRSEEVVGYPQKNIHDFFMNNAVFFDTLDEKFNDLRNSELNANGKRVLNAYAAVFIKMIKDIYVIDDEFVWSYNNLFTLLERNYDRIQNVERSYYTILNDHIHACRDEWVVSTTNYTDILKNELENYEVNYLHGKLCWFEDYKHLMIYDCSIDAERKKALSNVNSLMPFILIPSGVKPLICKKQIDQFKRFSDGLFESNVLIVVGYRFNTEDNHINSIIGEWLRTNRKNKIVYLDYDGNFEYRNVLCFEDATQSQFDVHRFDNENKDEEFLNCFQEVLRDYRGKTI